MTSRTLRYMFWIRTNHRFRKTNHFQPGTNNLELDENIGFVVDLDVSDPNATAENPDIVFIISSLTNEIRSLDHTENNSSVAVMYPASGTSLIEPFTEPIQVVAGDFDKDGFDDLIVLDKDSLNPSEKEIHYLEWDNNAQSFATSTVELVLGAETILPTYLSRIWIRRRSWI